MSGYHSKPIDPRFRCRETRPNQSCYHHLVCGHDVITSYSDKCAPNCVKQFSANAIGAEPEDEDISQEQFVCPTCLDTYTMAMAIEKKSEFGPLSTQDHPDANIFNEMYAEGLENDMKELRNTVFNKMRPCRAAMIHGEYGQRVRTQRAKMLDRLQVSTSSHRPRDDRSRSPARSDVGGDSYRTSLHRERSPPRSTNFEKEPRAQLPALESHEITNHLNSLMRNEQRLVQLMQAMSMDEDGSHSITQMMLNLKLKEDETHRSLTNLSGETEESYMAKFLEWCKGAAPMEDSPVMKESEGEFSESRHLFRELIRQFNSR